MKPPQQVALYGMPDEATAKRHTYATVSWAATPSQIVQMKTWGLKLYAYRNFEATNTPAELSDFKARGWILKDSAGKDLSATDITTEYLIDPGNTAYRAWLVTYCQARKAEGYDGVFADNFPRSRTPNKYRVGTKTIVNPRTKAAYTSDDWVTDELTTAAAVQAVCPIVGNGIPQAHDETGYLANKTRADRIIASSIAGLMVEGPVAWSLADYNGRSETVWKQNIDLIQLLVNTGKVVMFSNTGSTDLESDDVARFVYCSYAMTPPSPKYSVKFRGATYMNGSAAWTALVGQDLGEPVGAVTKDASGYYVREYTGGKVRVNPATHQSEVILTSLPPDPCADVKAQLTASQATVTRLQAELKSLGTVNATLEANNVALLDTINGMMAKIAKAKAALA